MKYWLFLLLLGLPTVAMSAPGAPQLIAEADADSGLKSEPASMQQALKLYEEAKSMVPQGAEPCWKASRAAWWLGMQNSKKEDKRRYFQEGIDMAKEALHRNPESTEGFYWLGTNEVFSGYVKGMMSSLMMVHSIRHSMQEVIQRNDHYMGGGAYSVLGILNTHLPRLAGGNKNLALKEFNQSLSIEPQNPLTLCGLASYYVEVGNKNEARAVLDRLDRANPPPDLDFELQIMRQEGRKLRTQIKS